MSLHDQIRTRLIEGLATALPDQANQLNDALRLLSKWRCVLIQNTLLQQHGSIVLDGPLKGLHFVEQSAEGCHVPKLLGCYEQPLLPFVEHAINAAYPVVLNIGCAEGYYAVGMARRMPQTRILAFDTNPKAQDTCRMLAEQNGVAEQVQIGPLFTPEDFAAFSGERVLVMCDIEGGEGGLLDPVLAPVLKGMDLIVEVHEAMAPGVAQLLIDRFAPTHDIVPVQDDGQRSLPNAPDWFQNLAHLDQLLAVWEWRSTPTPWLVMTAKDRMP